MESANGFLFVVGLGIDSEFSSLVLSDLEKRWDTNRMIQNASSKSVIIVIPVSIPIYDPM